MPLISTDLASAELIKYAANAFLALKISYINEIGQLAEKSERTSSRWPAASDSTPASGRGSCKRDRMGRFVLRQRHRGVDRNRR